VKLTIADDVIAKLRESYIESYKIAVDEATRFPKIVRIANKMLLKRAKYYGTYSNIQRLYNTVTSSSDASTKRDAATKVSIQLDRMVTKKEKYASNQSKLIESYVKAQADLIFLR
ncbi:hypothetical protein L0F63_005220, partial [Massospora cicadina]